MQKKILDRLMRSGKAMNDFKTTGRLPVLTYPDRTPLWILLNSLSPMERFNLKGVTLSPKLGYRCNITFNTGEQLFAWLGGKSKKCGLQSYPCDSYSIKLFNKRLTLSDLK